MSGESDLINLYSERILELATNVPHVERLDTPDASAKKRWQQGALPIGHGPVRRSGLRAKHRGTRRNWLNSAMIAMRMPFWCWSIKQGPRATQTADTVFIARCTMAPWSN